MARARKNGISPFATCSTPSHDCAGRAPTRSTLHSRWRASSSSLRSSVESRPVSSGGFGRYRRQALLGELELSFELEQASVGSFAPSVQTGPQQRDTVLAVPHVGLRPV